jgi:putative glycosyltransferase (TIGR04372 family)
MEPFCVLNDKKINHKLIIINAKRAVNSYLISLWADHFIIINNTFLSWLISSLTIFKLAIIDCSKYERIFNRPRLSYKIFSDPVDFKNIINIPISDEVYLRNFLESIGMEKSEWYVCVHCREDGFSTIDDEIQMYRNSDFNNYSKSIDYILNMGGWVIRIGHSNKVNNFLIQDDSHYDKFFDYSISKFKNDKLDVLLCKYAKFILGGSSGICTLGTVLGTPCAITNLMPTSDSWYTKFDIYMTKKIFSLKNQRFLNLEEMLTLSVSRFRYNEQYHNSSYVCVENTADEIYNLTAEMMNFINNDFIRSRKQILVNRNIALFRTNNSNAYYSDANFSISFYDDLLKLV